MGVCTVHNSLLRDWWLVRAECGLEASIQQGELVMAQHMRWQNVCHAKQRDAGRSRTRQGWVTVPQLWSPLRGMIMVQCQVLLEKGFHLDRPSHAPKTACREWVLGCLFAAWEIFAPHVRPSSHVMARQSENEGQGIDELLCARFQFQYARVVVRARSCSLIGCAHTYYVGSKRRKKSRELCLQQTSRRDPNASCRLAQAAARNGA
jgi:hypothetical protein